jgi:hypothetical protein
MLLKHFFLTRTWNKKIINLLLKTIPYTKLQLIKAEKLLSENRVDECFGVCREIQQLVDTLVVDESSACVVASLKEKYSAILRKLNLIMANSIRQKNYQHRQ